MFYVHGLFNPSLDLEICINKLKELGYNNEKLSVVVLDRNTAPRQKIIDSMNTADSFSLIDGMAITGSIGMILGVIYGSQAALGPIALGLIGLFIGSAVGFLLDLAVNKKRRTKKSAPSGEIIVIVSCQEENEAKTVKSIMKKYHAAALSRGPGSN